MGDPLLPGHHQSVIRGGPVAESGPLGGKGRVGPRRQVEEAGMRRVANGRWEVCVGFAKEPVAEHALIADAEHPRWPELARDGHRGLMNFRVLDCRRNRADAPEAADWMEQRKLRGAWRVRVHLIQDDVSEV